MPNLEGKCLSSREITAFNVVILTKYGNKYVRLPTTNKEKEQRSRHDGQILLTNLDLAHIVMCFKQKDSFSN
jgi:hypothetical protein